MARAEARERGSSDSDLGTSRLARAIHSRRRLTQSRHRGRSDRRDKALSGAHCHTRLKGYRQRSASSSSFLLKNSICLGV